MRMLAGTTVTLTIQREVEPYGYFLSDEEGSMDILLPYSETEQQLHPGEQQPVFLFHDSQNRLTATTRKPIIQLGELACLAVADIHPRYGCFLEMGIGRQLLLPVRELPEQKEYWPIIGDQMFVVMEHDKQGRMLARTADERDLAAMTFEAPEDWKNRLMSARVYKKLQMGDFVIVDGGVLGFGCIGLIHDSERTRSLRIGEEVQVRVTYIREDGRVNLSMKAAKEISQGEDAQRILDYLSQRPGATMPYTDKTEPDIIREKFAMSKAAFKRALGKLMKEGLIVQKADWTSLSEKPVQEDS